MMKDRKPPATIRMPKPMVHPSSSLAAGHNTLLPQRVDELKKRGRGDILAVIGGVIPAQDYEFLYASGATLIFGPGTVIPVAAQKVLEQLNARKG